MLRIDERTNICSFADVVTIYWAGCLKCSVAVHRPDLGSALGLFTFSHSPAPGGGATYRKWRQKYALHRQARTCGSFVMAKKRQRTDDLIDALVWMRRQESSPTSAAKNDTQVERDAIARLAMSVVERLDQSVILRRTLGTIHRDQTSARFAYGAGMQARLSAIGIRLEYERISASGGDPDLLSLGVTWSF